MAKEKELAVVEEEIKDLSIFAVEEGQEEHLSQDEMEMPFLKLAQKSTGQTDSDKPEYIPELKPGMFFNTVSGAIYGDNIKVQVHGYFHKYVIWKGPKGNGKFQGTMTTEEFRAFDKANSLTREGGDMIQIVEGETLRYTDTHSFIVSLPEHEEDGILIYPLSSTGCKVARKWNSLNTSRRVNGVPAKRYATLWDLTTGGFVNDGGFAYKQVSKLKPHPEYRNDCFVSAELMAFGKSFEEFTRSIKEHGVKHTDESTASGEAENSDF